MQNQLKAALKRVALPIYPHLPTPVKKIAKKTYHVLFPGTQKKAKPSSELQQPRLVPITSTDNISYDIQNIDRLLHSEILPLHQDGSDWVNLDTPIVFQLPRTNAAEIQLSFNVSALSLHSKSAKLKITPSFDGQAEPSEDINLSIANGVVAFRLANLKPYKTAMITIESNEADVKVDKNFVLLESLFGISTVIAVYKEEERIQRLLNSLSSQTTDYKNIEYIFVINGPKDRSEDIITTWMNENPEINCRILIEKMQSASNARNAGIKVAKFSYITFIDADDFISNQYFESLIERISQNSIACSHIVNIDDNGTEDAHNTVNNQLLTINDYSNFSVREASSLATMSSCKAFPTFMARCVPMNTSLVNGEDTPFYCEIFSRFPKITLNVDKNPTKCIYYRHIRNGSLSRPGLNYEFYVPQRLAVIKEITRILALPQTKAIQTFNINKRNAQVDFISAYLRQHPEDYLRATAEISTFNIPHFPFNHLKDKAATELVIAYCFPPFQDSSAIVMAKRLYERGQVCDVISNDMSANRESDQRLIAPINHLLAKHSIITAPISFAAWGGLKKFAEDAFATAQKTQESRKREYQTLYSRAQWVGSHFAAILVKLHQPNIIWTAEFSDPLLYGVDGKVRPGQIDSNWLKSSGLLSKLDELGINYDSSETNLFYWCELATIHLADKLVFTNENQLSYMREYQKTELDKTTIDQKAIVSHHPVARGWLSNAEVSNEPNFFNLNLAYFGSFYVNRGIGGLLKAIQALPAKARSKTRLYVFSRQYQDALAEAEFMGLSDIVIAKPELPYADMINELHKYDILVVNDAQVEHGKINPFLPSKLSDYRQSNVSILALYQPESAMSRINDIDYKISLKLSSKQFNSKFKNIVKSAREHKKTKLSVD